MSRCILSVKHSSNVEKTDVNVASSYEDQRQKRRIPGAAGSCSTLRQRQGEKRKKASSSLYLDELTKFKSVNSDIVLLSTVSLERLSPKGSCQLDVHSRNDTLAQKHHCELLLWNASHVQKQSSKT